MNTLKNRVFINIWSTNRSVTLMVWIMIFVDSIVLWYVFECCWVFFSDNFVFEIIDVYTFIDSGAKTYKTYKTLTIMKWCNDVRGSLATTQPDKNMLKNKKIKGDESFVLRIFRIFFNAGVFKLVHIQSSFSYDTMKLSPTDIDLWIWVNDEFQA